MSNIRSCTYSHQAVTQYHYTSTFIPQNQLPDLRQFRLKGVGQVSAGKRVTRRGKTKQKSHPLPLPQPQPSRKIFTFPSLIESLPAECRAAANVLKSKEEYEALRLRVVRYLEMDEENPMPNESYWPFDSAVSMIRYFTALSKERQKLDSATMSLEAPYCCPLLAYDGETGKIIECITTITRPKDMDRHFQIHINLPKIPCPWPECSHKTRQKCNLKQHIHAKHLKTPAAVCKVCGSTFIQKADRTRHCKQEHGEISDRAPRGDSWKYTGTMKQAAGRRVKGTIPTRLRDATWDEPGDRDTATHAPMPLHYSPYPYPTRHPVPSRSGY